MPLISGGGGSGAAFNGGTITEPLTIDLSDGPNGTRAFHVILPADFDFSVEAFTFEVANQFGLLSFTTSGAVSTNGNTFTTAGGQLRGRSILAPTGGPTQHNLDGATPALGFFGAGAAAQPSAIVNATGGVVIDAEARTALNTLLAAARTLGLIAT